MYWVYKLVQMLRITNNIQFETYANGVQIYFPNGPFPATLTSPNY